MRVAVTAKHYLNAVNDSPLCCPLALAVNEHLENGDSIARVCIEIAWLEHKDGRILKQWRIVPVYTDEIFEEDLQQARACNFDEKTVLRYFVFV